MHPYLFGPLNACPKVMKTLVGQIPTSRLDSPTHPGRFTAREVVAHMADWEPVFVERMSIGVATPGAVVKGLDESKVAIDHNYKAWDIDETLKLFQTRRTETIAWLQARTKEDWSKYFIHSEKGPLTIEDNANMLLGHDLYHLQQLSEFITSFS